MATPEIISALVARYRDNRLDYRSPTYKEFRLRKEFIDPFFEALGWDVSNRSESAEAYKDVVHEDSLKIGGASKAPDYAFRIYYTPTYIVRYMVRNTLGELLEGKTPAQASGEDRRAKLSSPIQQSIDHYGP